MKKTIKYQNVGEFQIITGVGKMTIDPASTGANSLPKIAELEISKTLKKKGEERAGHFAQMKQAEKIAGHFVNERAKSEEKKANAEQVMKVAEAAGSDTKAHEVEINGHCNDIIDCEKKYHKHDAVYKSQSGAVEVKNQEMKELLPEFDAQQKQVRRESFVYDMPGKSQLIDRGVLVCMQCSDPDCGALFYLPAGDVFACSKCGFDMSGVVSPVLVPEGKTVDELITVWTAQATKQATTTAGDYIEDWRGVTLHKKTNGTWESRTITELNDIPDELERETDLLTEIEKEEIRIQGLTPEDLAAEKIVKISELVTDTINYEKQLQLSGDVDYQSKGQKFYDDEMVKIEAIYG